MDATATINAVHIPHNGFPMEIVTLPLMHAAEYGILTSHSKYPEIYLTHVPCLAQYTDWQFYGNRYRGLVDLGNMDPDQSCQERFQGDGPYFMYKFSRRARKVLTRHPNKHFESVEGAEEVYGNAFIFKVKRPASQSESGVVEYEDLDKSFIDSAFKGKGISASESLRWLSKQ